MLQELVPNLIHVWTAGGSSDGIKSNIAVPGRREEGRLARVVLVPDDVADCVQRMVLFFGLQLGEVARSGAVAVGHLGASKTNNIKSEGENRVLTIYSLNIFVYGVARMRWKGKYTQITFGRTKGWG